MLAVFRFLSPIHALSLGSFVPFVVSQAGSHLISHPSKYISDKCFKQFTTNHAKGLILFSWLSEDVRKSTIKSQEINYTLQ